MGEQESETFGSVAALLAAVAACRDDEPGLAVATKQHPPHRARLYGVVVLERRRVSKDKLCFYEVSDRASSGARIGLRFSAGNGPGELSFSAAAEA
eukprot:COSAG05_NODE_11805_length_495_cov_1.042929_1_plen_95_part_10